MTDRLTMVTELGLLANEAAQRGDDRAAGTLRSVAEHLMEVHGELLKVEERRRKDRNRPRNAKANSVDSTDSADSTESAEKGGFPPDPLSSKKTTPPQLNRARSAGLNVDLVDADGVPVAQVDEIDEKVARFALQKPECWPSVSAFLCRRPLRTWLGWVKEMEKLIGPGSQYTEADLAATCDDDATLTRQIGSPLGLKGFLLRSREQRVNPNTAVSLVPRQDRPRSTAAQRTFDNGINALKDIA